MNELRATSRGRDNTPARHRRALLTVGVVAALVTAVAGCGADGGDSAGGEQVSGGKLAAGTYTFGYVTEETGTLAFAGKPALSGAQLAFKQASDSGELGEGVKLELLTEDSAGDQAKAIAAVDRLVANQKVLGLLCCTSSTVTGAIMPIVDRREVPTSITSAVLPSATHGAAMYRVKPQLADFYSAILPPAQSAFAPKTAVVTRTTDNDGMAQTADGLTEKLKQSGVTVTVVDLLSTDKDMSGLATQIIQVNPDVVFHAELASTMALSIRELVDRGYTKPQFGTDAMGSQATFEAAGPAAVGVPFPITYFPDSDDQATKDFVAAAASLGSPPPVFAAEGYSAARLLIEGLKKAAEQVGDGDLDRKALAAGLDAVETLTVPLGTITLNDQHQGAVEKPFLLQFDPAGKLVEWDGTAAGRLKP
ncbi:ABC transporter substrate-binding protein [Micromonospora cathayae]|uniref:ABC transporter substrate-binding protein n=1 Tax=Micromonospora cathayae TaxID=3028804 RepID=A0ABY7ZMR3_9ACTN|nr:ABC transporter substrate-binding protein [Micromonospora sp. HUAS 3]WDZ83793.1 ABC transporter substrate-binding protein [Micromonospora sp. HUAS 3]